MPLVHSEVTHWGAVRQAGICRMLGPEPTSYGPHRWEGCQLPTKAPSCLAARTRFTPLSKAMYTEPHMTAAGVPGPWWLGLISMWTRHHGTGGSQSHRRAGSPLGIPGGSVGNVDFGVRPASGLRYLQPYVSLQPSLSLFLHCVWGENTFVRQRRKLNETIHGKPWRGNSLPASHNCPSCLLGHLPLRTVSWLAHSHPLALKGTTKTSSCAKAHLHGQLQKNLSPKLNVQRLSWQRRAADSLFSEQRPGDTGTLS